MRLTKLDLRDFKRVFSVKLELHPINVIVGGNNSGKSSVLQGIHFFITAAIASREARHDTYRQELLLFCPAHKFEELGSGIPYTNQNHKGLLSFEAETPEKEQAKYEISVYRGRNEGNVGCTRTGTPALGLVVTDANKLFSVYVPGLAGIPPVEQFRSESVVRRGVASGDANLYLRNVLWQISTRNKLGALTKRMKSLFPEFYIRVTFEARTDLFIDVQISIRGSEQGLHSVELAGTGVLQALQIFSYVTLYEPQLLLLDEPDSHLHPDNQTLLAGALRLIANETSTTSTQVILSTHSKHLVDAFDHEANFVWLRDGKVYEQGLNINCLPMLMEIGALNDFDRLKRGAVSCVFLSEDSDLCPLRLIVEASGFSLAQALIFTYRGSSNFETAISLASFIKEISPTTEVVVHRDRDFMTTDEIAKSEERIKSCGARAFITEGSDIESYFVQPAHVAAILNQTTEAVSDWIEILAQQNHSELLITFTRKRDEIKRMLYRGGSECPQTLHLLGSTIPLPSENRLGKLMLTKINAQMHSRFQLQRNLLHGSKELYSRALQQLRSELVQ